MRKLYGADTVRLSTDTAFAIWVRPVGDCWVWTGDKSPDGYGRFRGFMAHRWSYDTCVQTIPPGMQVDHLCYNRACVRPSHLTLATPKVNTIRAGSAAPSAANARKTHCKRGHEFTPENTRRFPSNPNRRACRPCYLVIGRERQARLRAERKIEKLMVSVGFQREVSE